MLAGCWGQSSSLRCFPLSCEVAKTPIPEPVSPELQRTVKSLSEMSQLVMGAVAKFKGKAKKGQAMLCCVAGVWAPGGCAAVPGLRALLSPHCFPWAQPQREILAAHGLCLGLGSKTRLFQAGPISEVGFAGAQGCGSWGAGSTSGLLSRWGSGKVPQEGRDSHIFLSFL